MTPLAIPVLDYVLSDFLLVRETYVSILLKPLHSAVTCYTQPNLN